MPSYLDLVDRLIAVLRHEGVEQGADEQDLLGLDLDVGRLPLSPAQRLVDHDARVRQRTALTLSSQAQQQQAQEQRTSQQQQQQQQQQQPQAEQSRTLIFWFFFLLYTCFSETYRIIVVFCFVRMSCFQLNLSLLYILRCDTHDSTHFCLLLQL